jgi:PKD repeat protein
MVANFTADKTSGYIPFTVQFTDLSIGEITSWDWDFGDGSPHSTDQNPSHTYNYYGNYTVSLIAYEGLLNDSISKAQYITIATQNTSEISSTIENGGGFTRVQGPSLIFD